MDKGDGDCHREQMSESLEGDGDPSDPSPSPIPTGHLPEDLALPAFAESSSVEAYTRKSLNL